MCNFRKLKPIVYNIVAACLGWVLMLTPARVSAQQSTIALAEMQVMANAMDVCAIDIDRYVSLENLNDISGTNNIRPYDSIKDNGGVFSMIPSSGLFLPRKDFTVGTLIWNGPYVNYQSDRTQTAATPYDLGSPLDPWGSPYYLFNPFGLIRGDEGIITQELYGDQFDRYMIISLGPDGVMSGDDIPYAFGPGVTSTRLTSLHGEGVTLTSPVREQPDYDVDAGTTLTLRGYNFGSGGPGKTVRFGSITLSNIISWNNREVVVEVPQELSGTEGFALQLNAATTNAITTTIIGGNTLVPDWQFY